MRIITIALLILVLGFLNYGVYQKEQIKRNGETVLLELAPVDPRSLMQGDYMRLDYEVARSAPINQLPSKQMRGEMVISIDENKVARFARFYTGERLKLNEKRIPFKAKYGISIQPDSFMFQEGHAEAYQAAKYGVFRFDSNNDYLLVGLADENRKVIQP